MKLSNKGRYAVQAVFDLAYHNEGKAAQIKDICDRQAIPARFLEQVFQDLKKAGIVHSKRGPRGGYRIARPSQEIRVGDVIRAVEGPTRLCPTDVPPASDSEALLREALTGLAEGVEACFDAVTIADLCVRAQTQGVARGPTSRYVYAI